MRFFRIKVISSAGILLAVFLSLEMLLRFIDPSALSYFRKVKMLHIYHPEYYVALKPNADVHIKHFAGLWEGQFTTNSMGFRASPEPDDSLSHLACLGDSLTMGFGVSDNETFCSLLNGIMIDEKKYQSFNLGVDAFGSLGYLKRLQEVSEKMKLDTVLLFVSANDYTMAPDLRALGQLSDDEKDEIRMNDPGEKNKFRVQFELTRISYVLFAAKLALEQLQIKRMQLFNSISDELELSGIKSSVRRDAGIWNYIKFSFYRFPSKKKCGNSESDVTESSKTCPWNIPVNHKCYRLDSEEMTIPELPDITAKAYDEMILLSKKKGFHLIPVMFPANAAAINCLMHDLESPEFIFAHQMKRYFEKRGVRVMDLSAHVKDICTLPGKFPDSVKKMDDVWDVIIPGDGHFTRAGNLWTAEAIKSELRRVR